MRYENDNLGNTEDMVLNRAMEMLTQCGKQAGEDKCQDLLKTGKCPAAYYQASVVQNMQAFGSHASRREL